MERSATADAKNILIKNFSNSARYRIIVATALLGGCAKSVQVSGKFPQPVMEPYPLVAGIRYPATLTEFRHTEKPGNEPETTIDIGASNREMFRALFSGMFAETVELPADANAPIPVNVDLIIEPTLTDVEIASPEKSGTELYTVWLNYNLLLSGPDRKPLGDWKVTAYGQNDIGNMGMDAEETINTATILALRDAAANIVTEFTQAPGIATLLAAHAGPATKQVDNEITEPAND